jgi:lysozyme
MSEPVKCIDISHWQGFPDFAKVKAAGVIAMIHKATEGTSYTDPNRAKNCANAIKAGIAVCCYHWIKPGNAAAQMQYFLSVVDPQPGERVVIDYEEDGCTLADLHEAVNTLVADPRELQITVYSGHLLKEQLGSNDDLFLGLNTDLWLAQYTTGTPSWPEATYPSWTLWQYSETGTLDGIDGTAVDLNRFNGSDQELLDWISPTAVEPIPPKPAVSEVLVEITAPPDVKITVRVNEQGS